MSPSWPHLTASDTLDSVLGSAYPAASSFHPSHVPSTVPVVRTVSPTYSHTLLHQTPNSARSIDEEFQHILDQLGPNELVDSGTFGNTSNTDADQFEFNSISPFPSRPPSSASDYSMFETHASAWRNLDASLGRYSSGPPSSGSEWDMYSDYRSNPSRSVSAPPFPDDLDWPDDGFGAFRESTSAFAPPLASDLEEHENDFGIFSEPTSNHSALDLDSDLVGTYFPESSLQPDPNIKGSSSDDGHTPYELTPDEIDVVIGPATATVTSSSARDSWPWRESAIVWTDPGVSSKVVDFPDGFPITAKTRVFHIELVNGIPSQFPIPEELTAFIVCADTLDAEDKRKTIDAILKDYDPHSYSGSTGSRREPDASVIGSLFGLDPSVRVGCRRVEAKCGGVVACESLDAAFLNAPRRFPDPLYRQTLIEAEMRTRELQDTSTVGRVLTFERSLQSFSCKAILADGSTCKGTALMVRAKKRVRNKDYVIACSQQDKPCAQGSGRHTVLAILTHIDEDILFKVLNHQPIVENHDAGELCTRVLSGRQGFRGKAVCPYNHMKEGLSFKAKIIALPCKAIYHAYCPWEDRFPTLSHTAVVIPTLTPHTHPPPPENKINQTVARLYMECARKLGSSATPARVDRAPTTIALLGTTPALFHPALANRDIRLRLIQRVKEELDGPERTGDVRTQVAVYLAQQQALPPAERYLQSSIIRDGRTVIFGIHPELIKNVHRVRTLDCDTTFKPVAGSMQIFEVNAWLTAINEAVTLGRVWMEAHDRTIFKQVWEELRRLVTVLTGRPLLFKGLHVRGTILGLNADMEVAPLLGFADAFLPTIDREELRGVVTDAGTLLLFVLRLCYSAISFEVSPRLRTCPKTTMIVSKASFIWKPRRLSKTSNSGSQTFRTLMGQSRVCPTPNLCFISRDSSSLGWWKQKLMHFWLLPATIQCLSRIPLNDWHTMPATTNLGEAQHARNNAETGTQMGIIESFKKYAEYDARRAAEINVKLATGNLNNNQNELVHRYASSNRRHAAAADKGMRARDADERVIALRQAKAQVEAELKQAVAESKSNSSGRVPAARPKGKKAEKIANGTSNVEQVPRRSSGRVVAPSHSTEEPPIDHQGDEHDDAQRETEGQTLRTGDEASGPTQVSDACAPAGANASLTASTSDTVPSAAKRKSTLSAAAPAPKPKRRKAGDPLAGWAIELVPGDKTTAVSPREYAQKEPEEFAAQYPQYVKFL
ncbi:hypothetical protein B0H11DRAFT_2292867 [Mycena galericulata]|nr:hypothetical protein B0H11DRAFT_2292867 [Mycena galericulata]